MGSRSFREIPCVSLQSQSTLRKEPKTGAGAEVRVSSMRVSKDMAWFLRGETKKAQTHRHTPTHTDTQTHTHTPTHTHTQTPMTHSFQLFAGSDPSRPSFARNPLRTPWVQWQGNLQARCACHARGRDQWMMVGEGETRSAMAVAERQWGQSRPLPTDLGRSPACAGRCQMASCHALHC